MSKSKASYSSPNGRVKAQYFNHNVGKASGAGGNRSKNGKTNYTGVIPNSSAGKLPDVLPPAPFPHLKGKP